MSTTVLGWSSAISGSRLPNFFPRGWGSHFWERKAPKSYLQRAGGARFTKNFTNLKDFENFRLKNAIRLNLGDLLNKIF